MYERIRNLCKEKGITIKQLEISCGFGQGTISHWKKSTPKADKILLVARELGVTPEYLLIGNQEIAIYDEETLIGKGIESIIETEKPVPLEGDGLSPAQRKWLSLIDGMDDEKIYKLAEIFEKLMGIEL